MSVVLVSDIFGKTPALIKLKKELGASVIVDPYDGKNMGFKNEEEAYSYFIQNVGLDKYLLVLLKTLKTTSSISMLIGFSIGASIVWRLSEKVMDNSISRAICFYGSQIRNSTQIDPRFEIELILPKSETHFDVLELKKMLLQKKNLKIVHSDYFHGFMNIHSDNYNKEAYREQINLLRSYLSQN